jgi:holo-[acyl-carrier protein] synthase
MIVGVGIDVCSIERMRKALERHGDRFWDRICSPAERADLAGREPATSLAGRFAAKEAFSKVLDGAHGVGWHEVEVRRAPNGRPFLQLSGSAVTRMEQYGADRAHVSITHDAGVAVAVVVLECTKPKTEG